MSSSDDNTLDDVKTTVAHVDNLVRNELATSVFIRVPQLFENLCNARPELVDQVCDALPDSIFNHAQKKWEGIKRRPRVEADLYSGFINTTNAIHKLIWENIDSGWLEDDEKDSLSAMGGQWLFEADRIPTRVNYRKKAAKMKPDFVFVNTPLSAIPTAVNGSEEQDDVTTDEGSLPTDDDSATTDEDSSSVEDDEDDSWFDSRADQPQVDSLADATTEKTNLYQSTGKLSWLRVLHPGEAKRADSVESALLQLARYQRQVFRECYDRRFVLGFTLTGKFVTLYLADREGVLGTVPIDIHKDYRKFVAFVVSLAIMEPWDRGFDPTMLALLKENPTGEPVPSFKLDADVEPKDFWWVISMPKRNADGTMSTTETESFVLFEEIDLNRGEAIRGRATRIWKAWSKSGMDHEEGQRKIYIVKDSWIDRRRVLEGELYEAIGNVEGVAQMHSYGIVQSTGQEDSTVNIRKGLEPESRPVRIDVTQTTVRIVNMNDYAKRKKKRTGKQDQMDTRSANRGGLKTYLDNLPEIDQLAKYDKPQERVHARLVMNTYGWLARHAASLKELVGAFRGAIKGHENAYERGVLHRDISPQNILIIRGFGGALIDFDNAIMHKTHQAVSTDPISGTLPFMSGEIIKRKHYFPGVSHRLPPKHGVQHDMEAFFWSLTWIAMSRAKPGTQRQEFCWHEEEAEEAEEAEEFRREFGELFEDTVSAMGTKKLLMIAAEGGYQSTISITISPWCKPLLNLLLTFHELLSTAYKSKDFSGLHTKVYQLFDEEFHKLPEIDEGYATEYQNVMASRSVAVLRTWPSPLTQIAEDMAEGGEDKVPRPAPQIPKRYIENETSPTPASKRLKHSRWDTNEWDR